MEKKIITIDGPAGAGKTSVSKLLARKIGCVYVDTGALYRGVAFEILRQDIDWKNNTVLEHFLKDLDLNLVMEKNQVCLLSSGRDITPFIRTSEISMLASASSAKPQVRAALLDIQRNIAKTNNAVFEGRDMGTIVFPDAPYKFFLVADIRVRAKRRYKEMADKSMDIKDVQKQMETRDNNDSRRKLAPLIPAKDAIKIDASSLTIEQVVEKMTTIIEKACKA